MAKSCLFVFLFFLSFEQICPSLQSQTNITENLDELAALTKAEQGVSFSVLKVEQNSNVEEIMKENLQTLEGGKTLSLTFAPRGGCAERIIVSPNLIARLNYKNSPVQEAQNFYDLAIFFCKERLDESKMGFKVCLPLSIKLIEDNSTHKKDGNFTIMPKAKGEAIYQYINNNLPSIKIDSIFSEFGKNLAKFQMYFMDKELSKLRTIRHGDLHPGNIFCFPKETSTVSGFEWIFSLIDCGEMSLESNTHFLLEPCYFIYQLYGDWCRPRSYSDEHMNQLTTEFLKGYTQALSDPIKTYMQDLLKDSVQYQDFKGKKVVIEQRSAFDKMVEIFLKDKLFETVRDE